MDKEIQANQWWLDMWHERTSPLDPSSPNRFWEKEKREKRKESFCRERVSTFSLNFPVIGPSNPGEPRDKVDPPLQELRVDTGFVEFRQLREVGFFFYLI